jgi:hypothetical protein
MRWSLDRVGPPWEISRPAIFEIIRESLDDDGSLGMHPPALPDEVRDPRHISWSAGSRDGVSRHFGVAAAEDDTVGAVVGAVTRLARRSTGHRAARLYGLISRIETLEYVDRVLPYMGGGGIDSVRLSEIGRWLATKAPDRSAVKFGIALMGTAQPVDMEVLKTPGAHDEFTLYVAVALSNANAGERALFELAKRVHGWGRVQSVERLAGTTDPAIQQWMITEGYRNSIMYEYLAATCATTGRLAEALATAEIDDELIRSAGELIAAILVGEPGQPPGEYVDLVPTIRSYLTHLTSRIGTLIDRQVVVTIRHFLEDPGDVDIDEEERLALVTVAEAFAGREHFCGEAERGPLDPEHSVYWAALSAAKDLDIDCYDAVYHRIDVGLDEHPQWFHLLAATDDARLERTLALGRRMIDFDSIATGAIRSYRHWAGLRGPLPAPVVPPGSRPLSGFGMRFRGNRPCEPFGSEPQPLHSHPPGVAPGPMAGSCGGGPENNDRRRGCPQGPRVRRGRVAG